ncbi:MAG: phosphoribosyl-AMP cyclohydrolase [Gallionella sp.]
MTPGFKIQDSDPKGLRRTTKGQNPTLLCEELDNEIWLNKLKWPKAGLLPAIAQDATSGRVLMVAWMNRTALQLTAQTNEAVYWSRSRQKLWHKGEESGHIQKVKEIRIDCDADVVLLQIEQQGGIACHTGRESCFFTVLLQGEWQSVDVVLKSPDEIYSPIIG